jgi:ketosteroid isomerase-like protein
MSTHATVDGERHATAEEFVLRFERAWATSDLAELEALWTDDIVLIQPLSAPAVGREQGRKRFSSILRLIPDLHATVHRWAANGDVVFIEFTLSGTFGGREVSWPAVDRFLLRDGLAAERVSYFDAMPLMLQMAMRPRGWKRLISSGFRPSFARSRPPRRG